MARPCLRPPSLTLPTGPGEANALDGPGRIVLYVKRGHFQDIDIP